MVETDQETKRKEDICNAALNVRNMHPNTRNLFKARCAEAGMSMERVAERIFEMVAFREIDLRDLGIRRN